MSPYFDSRVGSGAAGSATDGSRLGAIAGSEDSRLGATGTSIGGGAAVGAGELGAGFWKRLRKPPGLVVALGATGAGATSGVKSVFGLSGISWSAEGTTGSAAGASITSGTT